MGRDHTVVMQPKRIGKSVARKNQLISALASIGYATDDQASTTTYVAMSKPGMVNKFFVGRQGDLRLGLTYKTSQPTVNSVDILLRNRT